MANEDESEGPPKSKGHSVKVPRLYKVSASLVSDHSLGKGSVKSLVYDAAKRKSHPNVKAVFSLVSQVVSHRADLDILMEKSQILEKERPLQDSLARVLMAELLWGKGQLSGQSKPVATINRYKEEFRQLLITSQGSVMTSQDHKKKKKKPRYVRINRLKCHVPERTIASLKSQGFKQLDYDTSDYEAFLHLVNSMEKKSFVKDFHLDDLLVFGPGTEFHAYQMYQDGSLVLQDKASCLTVAALFDRHKGRQSPKVVLDACAAPGMKTIQAAAALHCSKVKGQGHRMVAIERDRKRCSTLKATVKKHGAGNIVKVLNEDFLRVCPDSVEMSKDVEAIVLDPSCSGSGIRDTAEDTDTSAERLDKLAALQTKLLRHALTAFPKVKAVAYSTCSVEKTENEAVVWSVLSDPEISGKFRLRDNVLPQWRRRGDASVEQSLNFIRADPIKDACHGFFVAVIERIDDA